PRIATRAPTPADSLRGQSPARDGRPINCDLQALRRVMALAYLLAGPPSSMPTPSPATSHRLAPPARRPLRGGPCWRDSGASAGRRSRSLRDGARTQRGGGSSSTGSTDGNPGGSPRPHRRRRAADRPLLPARPNVEDPDPPPMLPT